MAQSDIDKILEDIRKRKEMSRQKSVQQTPPPAEKAVAPAEAAPQPEVKEDTISESGRQALSAFMNNTLDTEEGADDEKLDAEFESSEYVSKKSEDYIDENFVKFFTQSVIVTKAPEETGQVQVKRKKGLFKRKYITDSLSLNIDNLEDKEEEKEEAKPSFFRKKEKKRPADNMPIVKTAGDSWLERNTAGETEEQQPEKETGTAAAVIIKQEKPEAAPKAEQTAETPVKVYKPRENRQSLNAILGDDKDAESLASKILRQRKRAAAQQAAAAVAVAEKTAETGAETPKTETVTEQPKPQPVPVAPEEDSIISSIYTSIIEKQAEEELLAEQMTGYVPEIPEEETAEENTVVEAIEEEAEEEEVFEKYISKSEFLDGPDDESEDIQSELMGFRQTLNMRILLGFACGAILTYFNMGAVNGWPMPEFINPAAQPLMYTIACAVIYAIAFVGFMPTVLSGFTSMTESPAPDSFISLGAVLAMVQLVVMIFTCEKIDLTEITVFAAFVCITMGFNAMGKKIATTTIIKNLTLANAPSGINAGYIVNDTDAVKRLARTLDEKIPKVLVSRKAGSITNFVKAGFSIHKSDYTARKIAAVSYAVTAVCFVMALVISKSFVTAIFCAAGAAAMQIPLSQTLVNSVPSALMQKSLEKVGALVNGWQGIDQLSNTTHVNFDAKHLFPRGTVILHGIKTFEKERIDLAILYAASVLIKECDVLRPVFMEVIDGKTDILPQVDSCEYIELQGYVSWIENSRVIIGNRTLMEKYDVNMPPVSLEAKFTSQGRKPVYLAVGGKLFGMFVFSYRADDIVKDNLERLMEKGVSIILSSNDFNIDSDLIEKVYGIPRDYVSVLNQKETALLAQFTGYSEESECCVAHLDSLSSLVAGFCGAESARRAEDVCSIIQTISVIIGAVLAVMFTYSQTIMSLPLTSLMLISFGFMGIAMLTAIAKNYD